MNHAPYSAADVAAYLQAEAKLANPGAPIRTLLTDSRKLTDTGQALFFALKGNRNGHDFLPDVYQAGVRNLVISDPDCARYADANIFLVADTLAALQQLAAAHRQHFAIPVIGITGSNGKTIVKEWLYQLLKPEYNIVRSPKSYNSQIGVPVSVWEISPEHTLGIFEAGISKPGEMARLAHIIRPTIGVLTTIGEAHSEGFTSQDEKIHEKLLLFSDAGLLVYHSGNLAQYPHPLPGRKAFNWGYRDDDTLRIVSAKADSANPGAIHAVYRDEEISFSLPFTDSAFIHNALTCLAVLLAMGYTAKEIAARLQQLWPVSMRLEMKEGINSCTVIDDSYSLDLSSLSIALDFLMQQNQHPQKTLILSDIPESGLTPGHLYRRVGELLQAKPVDRLIGVGPVISRYAVDFKVPSQFFDTTDHLIQHLPALKFANQTILLKGARVFEFEKISRSLTQKVHETVLEINLSAIEHNLNYYKSKLSPGTKLMAVVKAFSYGSGSYEIASVLQFNKVDYLAVAYADEGIALRKAGILMPIMVMNPDEAAFAAMIDYDLEPEIYNLRILNEFAHSIQVQGREEYAIHLKIDTGMHRLGFTAAEVPNLIRRLNRSPQLKIKSIFSHLVASENEREDESTRRQMEEFDVISSRIITETGQKAIRHLANTSAIQRWPNARFDMVRLGIGLYGIDPSGATQGTHLQQVAVLKTSISQIKTLTPGETVGYNRTGKLPLGGTIATVKIGYADGYSRALSNGAGRMMVNGKPAPTIGLVCMDMCMLDITGIGAHEGDEVVVFDAELRIEDMARQLNTIPHEVLTGISERVKRVYYYE